MFDTDKQIYSGNFFSQPDDEPRYDEEGHLIVEETRDDTGETLKADEPSDAELKEAEAEMSDMDGDDDLLALDDWDDFDIGEPNEDDFDDFDEDERLEALNELEF